MNHFIARILLITLPFLSIIPSWSQSADFSANNLEGCVPMRVSFTDMSAGNPIAWEWDFGQQRNNTSQLRNPTSTYTTPGTYTITLTTRFAGGATEVRRRTAYIRVRASPTVNFSSSISSGCLPSAEAIFNNTSVAGEGTITRWAWVFGDGGISNEQSPTHIYTSAGQKSVTLQATNSSGCTATRLETNLIDVRNTNVNFSATPSCNTPTEIAFTNLSTGGTGGENFVWNFGDGITSTDQNPTHTYEQNGNRTISLSVDGIANCASTLEIQVGNDPSPNFRINTTTRCVGTTLVFENLDPGLTNLEWDWGDGRNEPSNTNIISTIYNTGGTYSVTLTATYPSGCMGSQTKQVRIIDSPAPDFMISGCESDRIFNATVPPGKLIRSWAWEFGDGGVSAVQNPIHTYRTKSNFSVKLTVVDNFGCRAEVSKSHPVFGRPVANFIPDQLSICEVMIGGMGPTPTLRGCAPHSIMFQDRSDFPIPNTSGRTEWIFGDGEASSMPDPTHIFLNTGDYDVTLTVTDVIGCEDQITRQVKVTSPPPIPSFSLDKTVACIQENVQFTSVSPGGVDEWCWQVEGDKVITGESPTYAFDSLGVKDITLTVRRFGCEASFTIENAITIIGIDPRFDVIFDCDNHYRVDVANMSIGLDPNVDTWTWDFGDTQLDDQSLNPSHVYNTTGSYTITLVTTDIATGCVSMKDMSIEIVDVAADFVGTPQVGCRNTNVQFTSTSTFAKELAWSFGDGSLLEGKEVEYRVPRKLYRNPGRYDVSLMATDIHGCTDIETSIDFITILDINGDFSSTIVTSRCNELDVRFTDMSMGTPPITGWQWNFGDQSVSNEQNPSHTYTTLGNYNVSLTLTNAQGQCSTTKVGAVNFTNPEPNFSLSKVAYCVGELFSINNQSTNATTYSWTIEGQPITTAVNSTAQYDAVGNFDVALTATDAFGCSMTKRETDFIRIVDITADFSADNVRAECPPLVATFTHTASDEVRAWSWTFGDGGVSNLEQPTYVYVTPGTYTVSLDVVSQYGCRNSITKEDFIFVDGPYGSILPTKKTVCIGEPIEFESNVTNVVKYEWDFGDGNSATTQNTIHTYASAATYSPTLQLEDEDGCIVIVRAPHDVTIFPLPQVDFSFFESYPFPKEKISFVGASGENITNWEWRIENQYLYTGKEIIHEFSTFGLLPTMLTGTDNRGCIGSIEKEIYVQEEIRFIPNVFTPNNDTKNSTFKILNVKNGVWDLTMYNRYGKLVYEMQEYDDSWKGNGLSSGTYYYRLKNRYRDRAYKGYVQLLR